MKPFYMTIQMEATEQYFHVVVFIFQHIGNGNYWKLSKSILTLHYTESLFRFGSFFRVHGMHMTRQDSSSIETEPGNLTYLHVA